MVFGTHLHAVLQCYLLTATNKVRKLVPCRHSLSALDSQTLVSLLDLILIIVKIRGFWMSIVTQKIS